MKEALLLSYIRTKYRLLSLFSKRLAARSALKLFVTPPSRTRNEIREGFLGAKTVSYKWNGFQIEGYRWRPEAQKQLLIIHGFESSTSNFRHFLQPIMDAGYGVVACDAPAHGGSSGTTLNALDYREFLLDLYDRFGAFDRYLCHSFGGLALGLAIETGRMKQQGVRIVMIAPAVESVTAMTRFFSIIDINNDVRSIMRDELAKIGGNDISWFSLARAAGSLEAEVLFLQDEDDKLTPLKDLEQIRSLGKANFQFRISQGLGHSRIYRDPETVKLALDFLLARTPNMNA